jgi:hypothetical protein
MDTKQFYLFPVYPALLLAAVAYTSLALASTAIVIYDFEDSAGAFENAPLLLPGLNALPWTDLRGSLSDFSGNPGRAIAARTFLDGNSLILALNVAPGFSVDLDGFSFDHLASASGPANWDLKINTIAIADGGTSTTFASVSGILNLENITDTITVALSGFGATSNSGTYRLDNFVLSGAITPVPIAPGIVLLGSALALMAARVKR